MLRILYTDFSIYTFLYIRSCILFLKKTEAVHLDLPPFFTVSMYVCRHDAAGHHAMSF